ncbi:MAG: DUF1294 domain-containing protein [Selenomonas ruminantium]|uniref:DUF1294 domain-containing protein n=1 Tax=Selenomonas ruminantium TaxID=971 RepID=A0A927WQB8_SELRU|nr:DUF1294 domain-containing protein [Selenomonas ruminantium]
MEISGHNIAMLFFAIINAVAVIVYGWDKLRAIRKWWRVPEYKNGTGRYYGKALC